MTTDNYIDWFNPEAERAAERNARHAGHAASIGNEAVAQELLSEARRLTFDAPRLAAKAAAEWAKSQPVAI